MKNIILVPLTVAGAAAVLFSIHVKGSRENIGLSSLSQTSTKTLETAQSGAHRSDDSNHTKNARQGTVVDATTNWHSLEDAFIRAQSFRAFYYTAMKSPKQGGYYYALKSLSICKNLPGSTTVDAHASKVHAINELKYRCDFTAQDYEDAQRQFDALRDFKFSDDPLFNRMFDFLAANGPAQRSEIVKATIREGNPDVVASIVYQSLKQSASLNDKRQPPPDYLKFAPSLIACELGADCGPSSTRTLELCAHTGWCGANLREELRSGLGNNFANLDVLVKRTVNYVRNEEIDKISGNPKAINTSAPRSLYKPAAAHSDIGSVGVRGIASGD